MSRWDIDFSPTTFDEMALVPEVKEYLTYYYDSGNVPHIILHGDTGTGKSTAAFILAQRIKPSFTHANIFDCGGDKGVNDVKEYLHILRGAGGGLTRFFSDASPECFIFDEFHNIGKKHQTMLNIALETYAANIPCFFCVNKLNDVVAEPIQSRCKILRFDVCSIINNALVMRTGCGWNADEWKNELRRVGRIVTGKSGYDVDETIEDGVLAIDRFCVDARKFIFNLGERYEMKSFHSKPNET